MRPRATPAAAVAGRRSGRTGDGDTIVAIATPPGRGGIGAVRLTGPSALTIAARLFRPAGTGSGTRPASPGSAPRRRASRPRRPDAPGARLLFGRIIARSGEPIDHGYLAMFEPPRSFTGEACAELWAHGSPAALRRIVEEAIGLGARPATPGEFTMRAFLNGRIDLTQAEAIRDLIEARTAFQAKVAHDQVMGRISREVDRLKDGLAEVTSRLEAAIEFGEEGEADRFVPEGGLMIRAGQVRAGIECLASTYDRGRRLRDGARVAIIGAPNVGKSSLFNRLLEEERAIVTALPGTTRDLIEETLDLGGVPVALIDTAGLHEPRDEADAEAVRRARQAVDEADLILLVVDRSGALLAEERERLRGSDPARTVIALNKADRPRGLTDEEMREISLGAAPVQVSARTGEGIAALRGRLEDAVGSSAVTGREQPFITNARHRDLLMKAAQAVRRAEERGRAGAGEEYLLLDLRDGLDRLGEITGSIDVDGLYDRIFTTFCIGK